MHSASGVNVWSETYVAYLTHVDLTELYTIKANHVVTLTNDQPIVRYFYFAKNDNIRRGETRSETL